MLLLAGGGGQQSVWFSLLGAHVTVFDLAFEQLQRDQQAATHYGFSVQTVQGDMRDLSCFRADTFDLVFHPYSLNFVPDARVVFAQVARVLRPGGLYDLMCANPFFSGLTEASWNGSGYDLKTPYVQGAPAIYQDAEWVYDRDTHTELIPGPQEFRQTLSTVMNGLVASGFVLRSLEEIMADGTDTAQTPGTWDHFTTIAPPWLRLLAVYQPDFWKES